MTTLTVVIVLALIATIAVLLTGIVSMARGGEFDRRHSVQLMSARVGLQGLAVLLVLVALYLAATA